MKSVYFASSNPEKLKEVRHLLEREGIQVKAVKMQVPELRSDDQAEIAAGKARAAFARIGRPVIAEDTGVYFLAYKNFPGVLPGFAFKELGYGGLLKLLKGKARRACFKTVAAYCDGRKVKTFEGTCFGRITEKPDAEKHRSKKFPYECLFVPEGTSKRFSRMGREEKAGYSHRAKAFKKLADWLKKGKNREKKKKLEKKSS